MSAAPGAKCGESADQPPAPSCVQEAALSGHRLALGDGENGGPGLSRGAEPRAPTDTQDGTQRRRCGRQDGACAHANPCVRGGARVTHSGRAAELPGTRRGRGQPGPGGGWGGDSRDRAGRARGARGHVRRDCTDVTGTR